MFQEVLTGILWASKLQAVLALVFLFLLFSVLSILKLFHKNHMILALIVVVYLCRSPTDRVERGPASNRGRGEHRQTDVSRGFGSSRARTMDEVERGHPGRRDHQRVS